MKMRLGVNIDHVATLRQVRGGTTSYPDILKAAVMSKKGGADSITIHLREDRRHIQLHDVALLSKKCPLPINLEMAATKEMQKIALKYRPKYVCLVPEKRQELTTEGGLDVRKNIKRISPIVNSLVKKGILVSMFIEPSLDQVEASFLVGAQAIELHTGHWVMLKGKKRQQEWKRLKVAAKRAHELGLNVHAGHGLDYDSTVEIMSLQHLQEVNIGHSLVCYAIEYGLVKSVRKMKKVIEKNKRKNIHE
jgi:pyridoxine 5-phosphate synthase